jgi:nucleoside-diphosphate-sugar epimerase
MDDYSLSKWIMEQQADSFGRRSPNMTISSLRLHALPDDRPELQEILETSDAPGARGLWGWTLISEAARACVLAVTQASFSGHEVFFIVAPETYSTIPSLEMARHAYPNLPIRGDLSGHKSFFDCSKAARLLGWIHKES